MRIVTLTAVAFIFGNPITRSMERYVLVDHTADMMVRAFGETLEECFANAGYALFDQTVDLSGIGTSEETDIRVSGIDDEDRLYSFLSELLFIEDCDNLILKEFDVSATPGARPWTGPATGSDRR